MMNNMNLCLLSRCPEGGFKSFIQNLSSLLLKHNHEVTIILLDNNEDIKIQGVRKRYFDIELNSTFYLHRKPHRMRRFIERVIFHFKHSKQNDVLKHQSFHGQVSAEWIVKYCNTTLDLSEFDCVISTEEKICNYFLANNVVAKRKIGYVHPDYLLARFDKKIDLKYFKKLDNICAVSDANANSLKKAFPTLRKKIKGIRNPIDVENVIASSSVDTNISFDKASVNLITVCRLDNNSKALDRLLILAKKLKEDSLNYVWRIIGDGKYELEMRTFIKNNGLENNVILLGYMDNPLPLVRLSDLFVLQSYYEGFPMSVCESLILNTPVLITNYPSAEEQIKNNYTGFIANNDIDSIYKILKTIIADKSLITNIKDNLCVQDKKVFENIDLFLRMCGNDE